jgi:YD repeat-containing protein
MSAERDLTPKTDKSDPGKQKSQEAEAPTDKNTDKNTERRESSDNASHAAKAVDKFRDQLFLAQSDIKNNKQAAQATDPQVDKFFGKLEDILKLGTAIDKKAPIESPSTERQAGSNKEAATKEERPTERKNFDGSTTYFKYDETGKPSGRDDHYPDGRQVSYDKFDQITQVKLLDGQTRTFERANSEKNSPVTAIKESNGNQWTSKDGRTFTNNAGTDSISGKLRIATDGSYAFKQANGTSVERGAGDFTSVRDSNGVERRRINDNNSIIDYDANSRVIQVVEANGAARAYAYDGNSSIPSKISTIRPGESNPEVINQKPTDLRRKITVDHDGQQKTQFSDGRTELRKTDGTSLESVNAVVKASTDSSGKRTEIIDITGGKQLNIERGNGVETWTSADGKNWTRFDKSGPTGEHKKAEIYLDNSGRLIERSNAGTRISAQNGWTELRDKDDKFQKYQKRNDDGSIVEKDEKGFLTAIRSEKNGERKFVYNEKGTMTGMTEPGGRQWSSEDGKNWHSNTPKETRKFEPLAKPNGQYSEIYEGGKTKTFGNDGSSVTRDEKNRVVETLTASNEKKTFFYEGDSKTPQKYTESKSGTEATWTKTGDKEWQSSAPNQKPFRGEKLIHADGSLESIDKEGSRKAELLDGRVIAKDSLGRPSYARIENKEYKFNYDGNKLVSQEVTEPDGTTRQFNAQGKLEKVGNPDKSTVDYNQDGTVKSSMDRLGRIREFSYKPGEDGKARLSSVKDEAGHWELSKDGKSWRNLSKPESQPWAGQIDIRSNGDYVYVSEQSKTATVKHLDGSSEVHNSKGGVTKFDSNGQPKEMITPLGEKRQFEYFPKGDPREGQLMSVTDPANVKWTTKDGHNWTSASGKPWNGSISFENGVYKEVDSGGNEVHRSVDGKRDDLNHEALRLDMEAIEYAMNGGTGAGTDTKTIQNILENRSEAQRKMIERLWNDKYQSYYGRDLKGEFADEMSGSTLTKFQNMLEKKDDKVDYAGDIKYALQDRSHTFSERSNSINEKAIRETLASMSSADIQKADAEYRTRFDSRGLLESVQNDSNISEATKEAAAILAKGADKRTDKDTLDLAEIALKNQNLDLFSEAWAGASPKAREQFKRENGDERMRNAFGGSYWHILGLGLTGNVTDRDFTRSKDYAQFGKLSVATEAQENKSLLGDNETAIEQSLKDMTDSEREAYRIGQALTIYNRPDGSAKDTAAREYYQKTHEALESAAGKWFSSESSKAELAKWEDMITTKGGGIIARIAEQRGNIYNSNTDTIMSALENMSRDDLRRIKTDPIYKWQLENTIRTLGGPITGQSSDEMRRALDLVDQKAKAEADTSKMSPAELANYERGRQLLRYEYSQLDAEGKKAYDFYLNRVDDAANKCVRRDVISAVSDNNSWHSTDEDRVYNAISNMTPQEIAAYKDNKDGFRNKLDQTISDALGSGPEQAVAFGMLQKALKGESPKQTALEKLEYRASCWTSDNAQVVRDIQAAFKDDPSLQKRIANPQTNEDRALSSKYFSAMERAMGSSAFEAIGKPLLETGKIGLDFQMQLNQGVFYPYEGFYKDAANAPAADRQALLNDPVKLEQALRGLGQQEREIALNALRQGEMRPEDKLRSFVAGAGTSEAEIKEVFSEIRNREKVREELSKRPELSGKPITEELISSTINDRLEKIRTDYATKYKESLSERLASELGGEDWVQTRRMARDDAGSGSEAIHRAQNEFYETRGAMSSIMDWSGWDGTAAMADSRNLQAQDALVKQAATGEEIPLEKANAIAQSLLEATDLRVQSEGALIDAGVDAAITAATIALLIPSGGSSISLMAATRFPMLARGATAIAQATRGLSQATRVEALATYLQNASRLTQIGATGLAGGSTKLGAHMTLNSRFDASSDGLVKFGDGFVTAAGQLVGAREVAALQGFFRESGERAAAKFSSEFLEQGGKAFVNSEAKNIASKGMGDLVRDAIANSTDQIDKQAVKALAEKMVKEDLKGVLREEAVATVSKEITNQVEKQIVNETKHVFKSMLRETFLNMEGGALSGLGSGLVHWNPDASIEQNLRMLGTSTITGAGMAGAFTIGLKTATIGFDSVSNRVSTLLGRESKVVDAANPQLAQLDVNRQIPQVIGEPKHGSDGSLVYRHLDGEMVQHSNGSLTIARNKSGDSITLDAEGKVIQRERIELGVKVKDEITYDGSGKLERISTSDGAVIKKDASGKWIQETIAEDGQVVKTAVWDRGDISVAPDGRLAYHNKADGSRALIRGSDRMEEHIDSYGRSTFRGVELANEKARLEHVIDSRFPDAGRAERFRSLMMDFENNAKARNLPESEVAEFYLHLNRMMADDASSPLSLRARADLSEQTLNHAAHPSSIDQGSNSTCNVTTLEHMLYAHEPSKIAQMITDVSLTGKFVTAYGTTVDLSMVRNGFLPDAEAQTSIRLQRDGTQALVKRDGPRDHASQIAETALVNTHYQQASILMKGNQRVADETVLLDLNKQLFHNPKGKTLGKVYDEHGKELNAWHSPGMKYYDAKGKELDPSTLALATQSGRQYVKGTLPVKDREMLFTADGKPVTSPYLRPGDALFNAEGKEIFRQSNPGDIVYDKPGASSPWESGEQLRLRESPNRAKARLVDRDGSKTDAPGLYNDEIADLYSHITGKQRDNPFLIQLGDSYSFERGNNLAKVSSEADLQKMLTEMQNNKQYPVIMAVYSNQQPFIGWVDSFFVGGSGGYHVINIQSFDPATGMVKFTNQWGSRNDHVLDGGVHISKIWQGMNKPKPNLVTRVGQALHIVKKD